MSITVHIVAICLTTIVLSTTLAHVLEWPGKMRLDRQAYFATQSIYYPGFTIAGFAEVLAIVATAALFAVAPRIAAILWLDAAALATLIALHATYWLMTHPVNKFWLKDHHEIGGLGKGFFSIGSPATATDQDQVWRLCRDRWELSHAIRATFAIVAFLSLLIVLSLHS